MAVYQQELRGVTDIGFFYLSLSGYLELFYFIVILNFYCILY